MIPSFNRFGFLKHVFLPVEAALSLFNVQVSKKKKEEEKGAGSLAFCVWH